MRVKPVGRWLRRLERAVRGKWVVRSWSFHHNRAMQTNAIPIWRVRMVTFAVAALAALTGTYWVLKSMQGHSVSVSAAMAGAGVTGVDPQAVARALGGGNTPVSQADGQVASSRTPMCWWG